MVVTKEKDPVALQSSEGLSHDVLLHDYDTKSSSKCQSDDVPKWTQTDSELLNRFVPKKAASILLSDSYKRLGRISRSERVSDCGSFLDFAYTIDENGSISETGKLHSANFCRDRLCPMCSWRRSLKIFGQVSHIMDCIGSNYKFLFLTLTVPNCTAQELPETLDRLMVAFKKLMHYKPVKIVQGFFRALEITRNKKTGTYHPHFHVILAVPLSYGGKYYIKRDDWLHMWQKAYKDPSITQVDIRVLKDKDGNRIEGEFTQAMKAAVAEVAKYPLKSSEYLIASDPELTDDTVKTLSDSLYHRRLVSYSGCFKDVFDNLALDDPEEGDLIHLDDSINESLSMLIVRYGWSCGVYKITGSHIEMSSKEAALFE